MIGKGPAGSPGSRTLKGVRASDRTLNFNRPHTTGREFAYIERAIENLHLSGNGAFSEQCADWLEARIGSAKALLTPSCTAALEMAVILTGLEPGDEVIMPSFTFVSTANAVVLRGGVPVFVDVEPDTLTIDPDAVRAAVGPRTRAILPVHYGGVGADLAALGAIAAEHGLMLIEDAAQGILASRGGRPLGGVGELGCLSFHETKNVICGEGGALLVRDEALVERAEILQEKGTNRARFYRGQTDKYTWIDVGSSYLPSEITAAFLLAQLEDAGSITAGRLALWDAYHERFAALEERGRLRRPVVPESCEHNAHLYRVVLDGVDERDRVIAHLSERSIQAVFHYVPLHSSPAGKRYGRTHGSLAVTDEAAAGLVRMPLWLGMSESDIERVYGETEAALG